MDQISHSQISHGKSHTVWYITGSFQISHGQISQVSQISLWFPEDSDPWLKTYVPSLKLYEDLTKTLAEDLLKTLAEDMVEDLMNSEKIWWRPWNYGTNVAEDLGWRIWKKFYFADNVRSLCQMYCIFPRLCYLWNLYVLYFEVQVSMLCILKNISKVKTWWPEGEDGIDVPGALH